MNHQLNQPRPNSVSQRPLPPIPLKSSEHVRPLAVAPTMASTRRKVSTGEQNSNKTFLSFQSNDFESSK